MLKRSHLLLLLLILILVGWVQFKQRAPDQRPTAAIADSPQIHISRQRDPQAAPRPSAERHPTQASPARGGSRILIHDHQNIESELAKKERLRQAHRPSGGSPQALAGEGFDVLSLRAVPREKYEAGMGAKVSESLGFVIFSDPSPSPTLAVGTSLPVVAKSDSGRLGIVTGTIIVNLKSLADAGALAKNYALELKYTDPDLNRAYFGAPSGGRLDEIVAALRLESRVERAQLEIIHSKKKF